MVWNLGALSGHPDARAAVAGALLTCGQDVRGLTVAPESEHRMLADRMDQAWGVV